MRPPAKTIVVRTEPTATGPSAPAAALDPNTMHTVKVRKKVPMNSAISRSRSGGLGAPSGRLVVVRSGSGLGLPRCGQMPYDVSERVLRAGGDTEVALSRWSLT